MTDHDNELETLLLKHWQPEREYTVGELISIFKSYRQTAPSKNTIHNWREIGIKTANRKRTIHLKMYKTGARWVTRGAMLIDFLLQTNSETA